MFQKQNNLDLDVVLELIKGESHLRALSKTLSAPPATVKRSVERLLRDNAADARRVGRNRVFSLKRTIEAREYALAAEHYKALKCIRAYPHLAEVMERALAACGGMVVLFGSHASLSAKRGSDVDVYCERIKGGLRGASVKQGPFDTKSPLIREIMGNHAIFRGAEEFYGRSGFFEKGV